MATNPKDRVGIRSSSLPNQQFFLVCGPIETKQAKFRALRRFARKYLWKSINVLLITGTLVLGWRLWNTLATELSVTNWWCEVFAMALFGLTVWLFRTFRIWHRERTFKATSKRLRQEEIPVLMCTPPPFEDFETEQFTRDEEFTIIINDWRSADFEEGTAAFQPREHLGFEASAITIETEKAA